MYERMYNYYFLSTSKRKFDIINSLNLDNYIYILLLNLFTKSIKTDVK